ncbi:MAG: hypothetical protein ACR2OL_00150 [Anderseniella sp.]
MNQFSNNRFSAIPPNGKLFATLLLSEMLSPPVRNQGSVDFQPRSVITRGGNRLDMQTHTDGEVRAHAENTSIVKPRRAHITPLIRVTALVGLAITFAGIAWIH